VNGTTLLSVGDEAPDFTAPASDGGRYRLSDVLSRGPVVLIFYPGNNTPG
jgi:peroxiredoxin Q/BCP